MLHGRGTAKMDFCVSAKPNDELSKFQTDRKFAFASEKLSMLVVFEKIVARLWKMNFSILRASARIPLYGCCTGAGGLVYGISVTRARKNENLQNNSVDSHFCVGDPGHDTESLCQVSERSRPTYF